MGLRTGTRKHKLTQKLPHHVSSNNVAVLSCDTVKHLYLVATKLRRYWGERGGGGCKGKEG